jgi:hypothetical protein
LQLLPSAADPFLGLFVPPGGGLHHQGGNLSTGGGVSVGVDAPFLTRAFNPERATLKLGLVYLDVLSVSGSVLYSDFEGDRGFPEGGEDGWLSAISVGLRVVIPLTRSIYLSAAGTVYYLPGENRIGFFIGETNGLGFGAGVRLAYEKHLNGWWMNVSNTIGYIHRFSDLYEQVNVDEIEVSGRYRFGRAETIGRRSGEFFDEGRLLLSNQAAFTAVGPLSPSWRLETDVVRSDYWGIGDSDDHRSRTSASLVAQYAGQDWRFAPFVGARTVTSGYGGRGDFEGFRHEVFAGVRGPITDRLRLYARVGYTFLTGSGTGRNQAFLYEVGFTHEVGPYTRQSLFGGEAVDESITGETRLGRYLRYTLEQRLGARASTALFAQVARTESLDTGVQGDSLSVGLSLRLTLTDFTNLSVDHYYDQFRPDDDLERERWILRARLTRHILPGLSANLLYQFEDVDIDGGPGNFREHLYMLNVTQLF